MFDVTTNLGPVRTNGRSVWRWAVKFTRDGDTPGILTFAIEGLAADLAAATREMNEAESRGVERLKGLGFEMRDTTA